MKTDYLLTLIFGLSIAFPINAYEVPTTRQRKNILLEEFTGIHCGYCPQGHKIANNLSVAQPEYTYIIAVHSGDFAIPASDEPDFRTKSGDLINNIIGAASAGTGYPSGMVNRHIFSGSLPVTGRNEWIKNAKTIHEENAPVNLFIKSYFNGTTRELNITVEGYYTQNIKNEFNLLNIALTQSNIIGPQNGGTMGSEYIHNHMLRDYITPEWGDTIKNPKQGEYFTRQYTYALPQNINQIELKAEDIELIAFVSSDKTEVLNVTGGKPVYSDYEKPLAATLSEPDRPIQINYGFNFFEVKLKNESNQTLTAAQFKITVNNISQEVNWAGNIPSFEEKSIILSVSPYELFSKNEYKIKLIGLNGESIQGNEITGNFVAPAECNNKLSLELQTDLYADENSFVIKDQEGNVIKEFGPYETDKKAIYIENIELTENKIYCFEITDRWGDGIQLPKGYYKIYNEDHSMVAQQYDIPLYGSRYFFKTSVPSKITAQTYELNTKITTYPQLKYIELFFTSPLSGNANIILYSISGEILQQYAVRVQNGEATQITIPSDYFSSGIYFLKIWIENYHEILKVVIS